MIQINVSYDESGKCTVMYACSDTLESRLVQRKYDLYYRTQTRRFHTFWMPYRRVTREFRHLFDELEDQDFLFPPET